MATSATANNVIEAKPRQGKGKNEARRERKRGRIPAVLYGAKKDSVAISLDPKQVTRVLQSETGHNTIFELHLDGERTQAMIVDWQYEPAKGALLHIDLKRIAMDQRLRVKVPVVLTGEAAGVKQQGGILDQILREVEVECLPGDIPTSLSADVSELVFGQVLRVSNLPHDPSKLRFVTDPEQPIAHITSVKEEEVAPAAEAAAGEAAAAPAEPEVIKKGKQEAEEGAEAAPEKAEKPEKGEKKEKK